MPRRLIPALAGRTIRCILFDLGDTLWTRNDLHTWKSLEYEANSRALATLRTFDASFYVPELDDLALGKRLRKAIEKHLRTLVRQNLEIEPEGAVAVEYVLQQWGIKNVSHAQCEALFESLRVRIPESRPLFDDVLPTLKELQRRGFQLGIVTNRHWGGASFQEDLHVLGLLDYFDPRHMAISCDLGIRKPNPEIFMYVLNALNIMPEEAVMVGDSLRSDVLGAQRAGIFGIWKPAPTLHAEVYARKIALSANQPLAVDGMQGKEPVSNLPPDIQITDDDYILTHIESRAGKWDEYMQRDIRPDVRIKDVSDLLDIFVEAGEQ